MWILASALTVSEATVYGSRRSNSHAPTRQTIRSASAARHQLPDRGSVPWRDRPPRSRNAARRTALDNERSVHVHIPFRELLRWMVLEHGHRRDRTSVSRATSMYFRRKMGHAAALMPSRPSHRPHGSGWRIRRSSSARSARLAGRLRGLPSIADTAEFAVQVDPIGLMWNGVRFFKAGGCHEQGFNWVRDLICVLRCHQPAAVVRDDARGRVHALRRRDRPHQYRSRLRTAASNARGC